MIPADPDVEQLTEKIIGCAIEVHRTLGAGLLESVYKQCMGIELRNAQLRFGAGLLLNFNVTSLRAGVRRLNHPDRYKRKSP